MNKVEAKDLIVSLLSVEKVRTTEFVCRHELTPIYQSKELDLLTLIQELVDEGRIKEEEYINPDMPYRIKTRIGI